MNTACTTFSFRGSNKYLSKSAIYWPQIDQSIQSSEISVVYIAPPPPPIKGMKLKLVQY